MRIGVVSDTHGNTRMLRRAVAAAGPVDQWLHAGDYSQDARHLIGWSQVPVTTVAGNCDGRVDLPLDEYVDVGGKKIWLTHGHRYSVKQDLVDIIWWGGQYEVDIAVFGHTHVPYCQRHGSLLVFNPGSLGIPRFGRPTYGLLTIDGDEIYGQIIEV
ncbi:MAG TPA: metallophosphoesterase [Patescibacteria group bacterium]|nr:metallophosphoesterase [Patescibacteria group bacterium]